MAASKQSSGISEQEDEPPPFCCCCVLFVEVEEEEEEEEEGRVVVTTRSFASACLHCWKRWKVSGFCCVESSSRHSSVSGASSSK